MSLRAVMDNIDDLPDPIKELFSERDGKFELTGVQGVKTEEDVRRLQEGIRKEREETTAVREKLKVWGNMEYEDVMSKLDRIPELETAAAGALDETKLSELAEKRAHSLLKPVERENIRLKDALAEREQVVTQYVQKEQNRLIYDALRSAGNELKMLDSEDAVTFGQGSFRVDEDGQVTTEDGLSPLQFLTDLRMKKGHLWGPTSGGGAHGGAGGGGLGGANPFSSDHWNMTEQGKLLREYGMEKAQMLAKAAGTTVGGGKPRK